MCHEFPFLSILLPICQTARSRFFVAHRIGARKWPFPLPDGSDSSRRNSISSLLALSYLRRRLSSICRYQRAKHPLFGLPLPPVRTSRGRILALLLLQEPSRPISRRELATLVISSPLLTFINVVPLAMR